MAENMLFIVISMMQSFETFVLGVTNNDFDCVYNLTIKCSPKNK